MTQHWTFDQESRIYYWTNKNDMGWIGKNTIGWISCRGTRLWINPKVMLYCKQQYDYDDLDIFADYPTDLYDNLNVNEDCNIFQGDDFSIRFGNFGEFVEALENQTVTDNSGFMFTNNYNDISENHSDDFKNKLANIIVDFTERGMYMYEIASGCDNNIGVIYKYDDLLAELKSAHDIAIKNNVRFMWI